MFMIIGARSQSFLSQKALVDALQVDLFYVHISPINCEARKVKDDPQPQLNAIRTEEIVKIAAYTRTQT
jgi:hypothetical protein